jgi:hypothetical protein
MEVERWEAAARMGNFHKYEGDLKREIVGHRLGSR